MAAKVDRILRGYNPTALDDRSWPLVRDEVLELVRLCGPDDRTARNLLAALTGFLALTPLWDRVSPVRVAEVLHPASIQLHTQMRRAAGYTGREQSRLLALYTGRSEKNTTLSRLRASTGVSSDHALDNAADGMQDSRPSLGDEHPRPATGLTPDPRDELPQSATLWRSITFPSLEDATMPERPPHPGVGVGPRGQALSRTAALREAKKRHAAAEKAMRVIPPAPLPQLSRSAMRKITTFRPQRFSGDWSTVEHTCRLLAQYYDPPESDRIIGNVMWHLSRYLLWVSVQPHRDDSRAPVRLDEVQAPWLLDLYVATSTATPQTVAGTRSIVRRALRRAQGIDPQPIPHRTGGPVPLSTGDVLALVRFAQFQPTPATRRNMCFIVGLALGAGLRGKDLTLVSRNDLRVRPLPDGSTVLTVTVVRAGRSREVVVAEIMRPMVQAAMDLHDQAGRSPGAYILGTEVSRDSVVARQIAKARPVAPYGKPAVDCYRMRATWLVGAMDAGVPLPDILRAAELKSARPLLYLVSYCTSPQPGYLEQVFANINRKWWL
jgi:hypothetical protein